jgi:PPE-repeat protein
MSPFGDAAAVTPEVNYTLMSTGDLGESLVQAAAGYESVADMLMAELTAMGLNTSTTAAVGWLGPGGVMMQMSAAEFMAVCALASAWVRVGQIQAAEVAAAHAAAVASMIPAEVSLTNRATQAGLVATNAFGQNTPGIVALDAQYFGHFWVTNATARTGYGAVVSTALGALAPPAPFSPTAADPAGPAAAVAGDAAATGGEGALQTSARAMTQVAEMPAREAGPAEGMMSSLAGQAGGIFGQAGSALGQVTSTGQQLPSMLGQVPQAFSGMLGPLGSMSGLGSAGALPEVAGPAGTAMPLGGVGALSSAAGLGGGGGGGLMGSGSSALSSTFVRPANSFSTPNSPTLPGGWQGATEAAAGSQTRPAGMGGGGLYGAPPATGAGSHGGESPEKATRTMRVTARPDANRGESQRS